VEGRARQSGRPSPTVALHGSAFQGHEIASTAVKRQGLVCAAKASEYYLAAYAGSALVLVLDGFLILYSYAGDCLSDADLSD